MCDTKPNDLNVWVEDFLRKRRYSKYELELAGNTSKGDGYLGEVTFVKVLTGIGREEEKIYNLVIKSAKKSDALRKKTPIKEVFDREMFMYSKVFPEMKQFQLERSTEAPFMKFAKCYSVFNENQKEAIILQNLKYLEYDLHDRKVPQNLEHVLFVFENYGKFHAISMAMKKQTPELFEKLTENMDDLLSKFFIQTNMIDGLVKKFRDNLDLLKTENGVTYKKLSHFDKGFIEKVLVKERKPSDGIFALLHGDCWNNNMMFSYRDDASKQKPKDMMFLDFQLSTLGSPIYDLSYYLYAVADEKILKNFDLILGTYHKSLTSFLKVLNEFSYNITYEDIKRHWIEYGGFGVVMAGLIIPIELSDAEEVVDLAEEVESGDLSQAFNSSIKNKQEVENRIKAVFNHYASLL
ncbi:unnamed protein product [Ceutorhynchus assimilis]|uniref:CHK kinase-like domain-containing protein n=1 Tax=Ceutorhynchus assimilis TaxID=467358 RepID=A0A9N9QN73_9CUCU|nr:unnamed protein product [Ceutorhynchus assimilis]